MRVLHVLAERGFSGGEHQLLSLLRHLRERGHESSVVLNPQARFRAAAVELGLTVHEVSMRNDADLAASWRLRRLFRSTRPDLIHLGCSRSHKLGALASIALRDCAPRVATRRMDYGLPASRYRRWLYGRAVSAVVAVSAGVRDEVLRIGVDPARVQLIHDGVDVDALGAWSSGERRAAARAELGLREDDVCGVTSASLHWRKGLDVLLAALPEVELPGGEGRLIWLLAGEGPMREKLAQIAAELPPPAEVRLLGHVAEVGPLLAAADLFCLPSRKEGLGVALLEAMAAGVPAVASATGGIREAIVDGVTGWLVPPDDPTALAAALTRMLSGPAQAATLAQAARRRVHERFSVAMMCERTEALYVALAGGGNGR